MSNEEMNRAIAEVCGWTEIKYSDTYGGWQGYSPDALLRGIYTTEVPNYTGSLDAMHEAEKALIDHTGYWQQLQIETGGLPLKFNLVHATASQKARAFLHTVGRWQEKEKGV